VPTPFYHLSIAADLFHIVSQAGEIPTRARGWLAGQRCAFLLGNTAPDVQVVSGQTRQATHFFSLPIEEAAPPPWELLLQAYPWLGDPARLAPDHAAFLAGYLCHLLADWRWIREIYAPVFGPECAWASFPQRLTLHNVLRAYLDRQVLAGLPDNSGLCLEGVDPQGWLPFVDDAPLRQWRDFISRQLHPGAAAQTVEVFAARGGISPQAFHSLLDSEERMEAEVFARLPRQRLLTYRQALLAESTRLLQGYLSRPGNGPGRRRADPRRLSQAASPKPL
jgi:hypothetical protein